MANFTVLKNVVFITKDQKRSLVYCMFTGVSDLIRSLKWKCFAVLFYFYPPQHTHKHTHLCTVKSGTLKKQIDPLGLFGTTWKTAFITT